MSVHALPLLAPDKRQRWIEQLGPLRWRALHSVASTLGLIAIIHGYSQSRLNPTTVYYLPTEWRQAALLLLVPVFPLLFAVILPGRLQRLARFPGTTAVVFWAAAHLLVNGLLADVLLFGSFLVWGLANRWSLGRQGQRIAEKAPGFGPSRYNDAIAIVLGLTLYAWMLFAGHYWLIGVQPLPY